MVGKLSGPPRKHEGGCFYPLPLDSITLARRAKARQVEEAVEIAYLTSSADITGAIRLAGPALRQLVSTR